MPPPQNKRARRGRDEGSVSFHKPSGLWRGVLSLGRRNGVRYRKTVYGQTKREAIEKLAALQAQAGGTLTAEQLTIEQLLARWMAATVDSLAATTAEKYQLLIRKHINPVIGSNRISKVTALHVDSFYGTLRAAGVSPGMIRQAGGLLQTAFGYAVEMKLLNSNPVIAAPKPQQADRDMLFLTGQQAAALLDAAAGDALHALLTVALATGCRQGELLALTWEDYTPKNKLLRINKSLAVLRGRTVVKAPKTKAGKRTIQLPDSTCTLLDSLPQPAGPMFRTRTGRPLSKRNVLRSFKRLVRKAGLPASLRFHDLRHTVASLLLSAGASVKAVSVRLGHSNPAMTLRVYAHCLPGDDEKLADTLGGLLDEKGGRMALPPGEKVTKSKKKKKP
jgi:integrase